MGRKWLLILCAVPLIALGASDAFAQSANAQITVTAANNGLFAFTLGAAAYDFGTVDSDGTALPPVNLLGVRNGADDGATYTVAGATTWTCRSAPSRTVRIYNASTTATINWGTLNRLSMQVPAPATGTSCAWKTFSTAGDGGPGDCDAGNLVHSVTAGNGANAATGTLDLELEVLDVDVTGLNTWTVVLTASGA